MCLWVCVWLCGCVEICVVWSVGWCCVCTGPVCLDARFRNWRCKAEGRQRSSLKKSLPGVRRHCLADHRIRRRCIQEAAARSPVDRAGWGGRLGWIALAVESWMLDVGAASCVQGSRQLSSLVAACWRCSVWCAVHWTRKSGPLPTTQLPTCSGAHSAREWLVAALPALDTVSSCRVSCRLGTKGRCGVALATASHGGTLTFRSDLGGVLY